MKSLDGIFNELNTRSPKKNCRYYAVTCLAGENGQLETSCSTIWVGYNNDDPRQEIREGRLMSWDEANHHLTGWRKIGESCMVINRANELLVFMFAGGNALIEKRVAHLDQSLSRLLQPHVSVRLGLSGFTSATKLPSSIFNKAPTPKHRMRVLKRDSYRCKICGRRSTDHVDVELHVHHIRPWSHYGVTADENLITLCHTCHKGLEPHADPNLFELIAPKGKALGADSGGSEYWDRVNSYRKSVRQAWRSLEEIESGPKPSNTLRPTSRAQRRSKPKKLSRAARG